MNSTLRIESLPRISELLSDLFQQLQIAGLLFANLQLLPQESDETFLSQLWIRRDLLYNIATMLESYMPGIPVVSGAPAISNTAQWNSGKILGGYAGIDLKVSLSDLLTSYRGCWRHAILYPSSTFTRYARLGFWYWREKGDFFAALGLILDLYEAGFILRMADFGSAIMPLWNTFTTGLDLTELWNLDFNSQHVDAAILQVTAKSLERPHLDDRVLALVDWVSSRAIEEADAARKASSLDQWLIAQARVNIMADFLTSFGTLHKGRLSGSQRVMVSQFEEIRADLGSISASQRWSGKSGSPFLFNPSLVYGVAFEYQRISGSTWLDKMTEDRVLLPDALCDSMRAAYSGMTIPSIHKMEIPLDWKMPSVSMGWPLCAPFNRNPSHECSFEFEQAEVIAKCRALGHSPTHGAGDEPDDFSQEAQAKARAFLSATRFQEILRSTNLFSEPPDKAIEGLEAISRLYPWNSPVRRELGIRNDQGGDVAKAFLQIRAALLLDPRDPLNWNSLSIILRRMGNPNDAKVAESISKTLEVIQS